MTDIIVPAAPGYAILIYSTNPQDEPEPEGDANGGTFSYPVIAWRIGEEGHAEPIFMEYADAFELQEEELPGYTRSRFLQTPAGIFDLCEGGDFYATRDQWEECMDKWALRVRQRNAEKRDAAKQSPRGPTAEQAMHRPA